GMRMAGGGVATGGSGRGGPVGGGLSDERRRLDELRAGNLAVRASFEVSFASLPVTTEPGGVGAAQAFRLLGLWAGPSFSLAAAAALLGKPEDAAAGALGVLVDAHLLDSHAPDRHRFHDLLRVYAADPPPPHDPD